jgi:integrase
VSLADARASLDAARALVKQGLHPAHRRRAEIARNLLDNENTFEALAREWLEKRPGKAAAWSESYHAEAKRMLEKDVYPHLGRLPLKTIATHDLVRLLTGVADRGAENVAINIRGFLIRVFSYAKGLQLIERNPAREVALAEIINKPATVHHPKLERNQISDFLRALAAYRGEPATRIALHLLLLTFVRKGELRGAKWSEFELDGEIPTWTIPPARMKMREQHIVPLSLQVVHLLRELHKLTGKREHLFPNVRRPRDCMADRTLNAAVENLGYGDVFAPHGLRATASTLLNEMGLRSDVIEMQLAHKERNKVRAAYHRSEYLDERRRMMQFWADYVDAPTTGAQVVPIRQQAA